MRFYVYIVTKGDSVYIGKGSGSRFRDSLKERSGDVVHIVFRSGDEDEAYEMERWLCLQFLSAKIPLLNVKVPWPQPLSGWRHSEETKRKMSEFKRELYNRPEVKEAIRQRELGRVPTEQQLKSLRESHNTVESLELARKLNMGERNPQFGRSASQETRLKMSLARKGKKKSEVTKQKIRERALQRSLKKREENVTTSN